MLKLSTRVGVKRYVMSVKPTETQLDYYSRKAGLPEQDYWQLMQAKENNPYLFNKYENVLEKAYYKAIKEFWDRCEELKATIVDINDKDGFHFLVEVPDEWIFQQLSNMPVVRKAIESEGFIPTNDYPKVPEEVEEQIDEWHPHG